MPAYRVGRSWIVFQAELEAWLASTSTESSGSEPLPTLQQMTTHLPPFLRLAEVAQVLCVSTATVTTLVTSRQLGSVDVRSVRRVQPTHCEPILPAHATAHSDCRTDAMADLRCTVVSCPTGPSLIARHSCRCS